MKQIGRSMDIEDRELPDAPAPKLIAPPPEGWPHVSDNASQQRHYELLRTQGQGHKFAEMVALRQCAMSHCPTGNDNLFRQRNNGQQLDEMIEPVRNRYLEAAKAAGVSVHGKVYMNRLARFNNDPKAWVSDMSEVKARCDEEGWTAEDIDGKTLHKPNKLQAPSWEKEHAKRVKRKIKKAQLSNGR